MMNDNTKFIIPAGTSILTRNIDSHLKMRPHHTRQELAFDERLNTGDGGFISYFQHGDWLIAVETDDLVDETVLLKAAG